MNLLQAAHLDKDLARVRKLLLAQIPSPGEPDLRGPEWHYWNRKFHEHEDLLSFSCLRSKSKYAADFSNTGTLSPDGVTAAYSLDDGQGGQTFQIWNLVMRRQLKSFTLPAKRKPKQESLVSVKFSQDGNRLAITRTGFNSGVAETKSDIQYWILDWQQDTNPRLLDEKLDVDQWLGDSSFSEDLVYAVEYLINKKERQTRMVIRRTDDFANVYEVTVPGDASAQLCANGTHLLVLSYLENYKFGDDVTSNSPMVSTVISYHKLGTAEPIWRQEFKSRQGFSFHQTIKLSGDQYHRLLLEGNNWVLRTSDIATNKLIRTRTIAPRSEVGQEFGDLDSPAFSWELSRDGQRLLFPTRYGLAVSDLDHQFSNFPQGLVPVKYDWQFLNCVPFSFGFLADGRVAAIWAPGNNGAFNLSRDPADKSRLITRVWSPPAYGSRVDEGVNLASTRDGKQYAFLGRRRPAGQKKTEVVLYVVGEPDGCTFQTVLDNLSSGDATNREVPAQGFLPPFLPMAGISA